MTSIGNVILYYLAIIGFVLITRIIMHTLFSAIKTIIHNKFNNHNK
jgi:hypothetical protein